MTERTIDLDLHRGMAAQQATDLRRLAAEVERNREELRRRQGALADQLLALPAENWQQAADKVRYLLALLSVASGKGDARIQTLITAVLDDFERLLRESARTP